jgi:hypothetical protein
VVYWRGILAQQHKKEQAMKKAGMLALFGALISAAAFGIPQFGLSAGAGGFFTADIGGGMKTSGGEQTLTALGGGAYLFMDGVFAELGLAFSGGGTTQKSTGNPDAKGSYTALDFSVLGKYPVRLGPLNIFPLAGVDYQIVLSARDKDGADQTDMRGERLAPQLSTLWFQIGAGADFPFGKAFFVRGEFLYGLRARNKFEGHLIDLAKLTSGSDAKYKAGHGPTLRIALGYKFF